MAVGSGMRSASAIQQPLSQQRYRAAGGEALAAFLPGGAGDVQVGPALAVGEARQEAGGGDRAGALAADVGDVGEAGIELGLVVVPQRQAPGAVQRFLAGGEELGGEVVVLAHQAGGVLAE